MNDSRDWGQAQERISQLQQEAQKFEEEVRSIRTKLHGAIRKGKASEAARTGLQKEIEELKARLSNQAKAETETSDTVKECWLENENEALKEQIQALNARLGQELAQPANGLGIANGHTVDEHEKVQTKEPKSPTVLQLQTQLSKWREQCNNAEQNVDLMREALQAAAEKIQEAEEAASDARQEAAQAEKDAAESGRTSAQKSEEAAELRKRVAVLDGQLAGFQDLEAELNVSNRKLEESRDESETFREEASRLSSQCRSQAQELDAMCSKIRDLEDEKVALQNAPPLEQANDGLDETRQQIHQELEAARAAKEEAMRQLEAARRSKDEASVETQARDQAAELAMQKLQAEDARRKQKFALLHSAFAQEKQAILDRLQASETETTSLRDQCQVVSSLRDRVASRDEELGHVQKLVKNMEIELTDLRHQREEQGLSLTTLNATLQRSQQNSKLAEAQAEESRTEAENLATMLEDVSNENDSLKERISVLAAESSAAVKELESLRASQMADSQSRQVADQGGGTRADEADPDENPMLAELEEELQSVRESLRVQTKLAANAATSQARLKELEKSNRELQWQIAMMSHDPESGTGPSRTIQPPKEIAGGQPVSKAIGLVLRYRRSLIGVYLAILHIILYVLLSASSHKSHQP